MAVDNKFFFFIISLIWICSNYDFYIYETVMTSLPEDGRLNFKELATKYGVNVEDHEVITEDGYILTLFQIIPRRKLIQHSPVLLQHGLADSADTFIIRGNSSLAITLAKAGYDVWVSNARGNVYSKRHKTLDLGRDSTFWDFSFHENGIYDMSAIIDHILNSTKQPRLTVIAHSQGNTNVLALCATRPEYNDKINVVISLAPVIFVHHLKPPVSQLIHSAPMINLFMVATGQESVLPDYSLKKTFFLLMCSQKIFSYEICAHGLFFAIGGSDPEQLERSFLPVLVGHYPQDTSRKSLLHLSQIGHTKRFAPFDYGPDENLKRYNFSVPPEYKLNDISVKLAIFVGKNDGLCSIEDVEELVSRVPNLVRYHVMKPPEWNHLDWIWGTKMQIYLYPHILELLNEYE